MAPAPYKLGDIRHNAVEELRVMARYFDMMNETLNYKFTLEELVAIYRYVSTTMDIPECYDTWDQATLDKALAGLPDVVVELKFAPETDLGEARAAIEKSIDRHHGFDTIEVVSAVVR